MSNTFDVKQFENFVLEPENLKTIKDAIQETFYKDEDIADFVTITKVKDGDPIAIIGEMEMVGKAGSGCDPTYDEKGITNNLERWKLGDWQVPIKICYDSLKGSIAEYSLKTGTDIGDLTSTDFMVIYTDALERAMKQMVWRFGWFGAEDAQTVSEGGKLTDDLKKEYFYHLRWSLQENFRSYSHKEPHRDCSQQRKPRCRSRLRQSASRVWQPTL